MRIVKLAVLAVLGIGLLAAPGQAQSKRGPRIFLETPVSLQFSGDISGSAAGKSGYVLDLGFPFHLGLGMTRFTARADDTDHDIHAEVRYKLVNVFTFFDAWSLNWRIGYGSGDLEVQPFVTAVGDVYTPKTGDASQIYVVAGWYLMRDFLLQLGYHSVAAKSPDLIQNGFFNLGSFKVNATAVTAGLQLIF